MGTSLTDKYEYKPALKDGVDASWHLTNCNTSAGNIAEGGIEWVSVHLEHGVAVAISGTGNRVMTSPDGVNWTLRSSAADNALHYR